MAGPVHVFVSHHHSAKEDAFTARLAADLVAAGADVWVDISGVPSGSFVAKISEGLAGRQWLVLVMTPASLASEWVRLEVDTAIAEHRAGRMLGVIPFVMLPCKDTDIPHLWRTFQRYDATKDYEVALDGLLRAMGLSLPSTSPADLRSLSLQEFEDAVALMLTANGYTGVQRVQPEQSADLRCRAPDGSSTFVWCNRYQPGNLVRQKVVIDAIGAVATARHPTKAMIVTTSGYTPRALDEAKKHADQVTLIDGQQLVTMMQRVQPQ
jgi:Restriction endonuclease/TIR domain